MKGFAKAPPSCIGCEQLAFSRLNCCKCNESKLGWRAETSPTSHKSCLAPRAPPGTSCATPQAFQALPRGPGSRDPQDRQAGHQPTCSLQQRMPQAGQEPGAEPWPLTKPCSLGSWKAFQNEGGQDGHPTHDVGPVGCRGRGAGLRRLKKTKISYTLTCLLLPGAPGEH